MAVANLVNNGVTKQVKLGFSWTTLFFGFFVPLLRGDGKNAIIFLVVGLLAGVIGFFTMGIPGIIYIIYIAMKYNSMYAKDLIEKGWKPATDLDKQLLISNQVPVEDTSVGQ